MQITGNTGGFVTGGTISSPPISSGGGGDLYLPLVAPGMTRISWLSGVLSFKFAGFCDLTDGSIKFIGGNTPNTIETSTNRYVKATFVPMPGNATLELVTDPTVVAGQKIIAFVMDGYVILWNGVTLLDGGVTGDVASGSVISLRRGAATSEDETSISFKRGLQWITSTREDPLITISYDDGFSYLSGDTFQITFTMNTSISHNGDNIYCENGADLLIKSGDRVGFLWNSELERFEASLVFKS